jgi:hypothetical protein
MIVIQKASKVGTLPYKGPVSNRMGEVPFGEMGSVLLGFSQFLNPGEWKREIIRGGAA